MASGKTLAGQSKDDLQPTPGLNSMVAEALSVLVDDIRHVDEIEEVITVNDPDLLPLFNKIKEAGIKRPRVMIATLIKNEAEQALENRRAITKILQDKKAAVFLPLPPHIIDSIYASIPEGFCFNTEDKEPAHLIKVPKEDLTVDNLSSITKRINKVEAVVLDGQKLGGALVIRPNVASILDTLLYKDLKTVYFHRIPHLPKGQKFTKFEIDKDEVAVVNI